MSGATCTVTSNNMELGRWPHFHSNTLLEHRQPRSPCRPCQHPLPPHALSSLPSLALSTLSPQAALTFCAANTPGLAAATGRRCCATRSRQEQDELYSMLSMHRRGVGWLERTIELSEHRGGDLRALCAGNQAEHMRFQGRWACF